MLRSLTIVMAALLTVATWNADPAFAKKKSTYRGCPAGLTFAPDLLKKISWARGVWGFPGIGYRPPKEWKCKN
jgi:hypothetical protein